MAFLSKIESVTITAERSASDVRALFTPFGFKPMGTKWIMKLKNGNVLQAWIATGGTADHYERIACEIINKDKGTIANNSFKFSTFLKKRTDKRSDYGLHGGMYLWRDSGDISWYIARPDPKEVKVMMSEVIEWAEHFG